MNRKRNAASDGPAISDPESRSSRRIPSAIAILALGLLLVSGLSAANGEEGSEEASAAPIPQVGSEVTEKRTATSQTFELADGTFESRLYQTPVNYRDEAGDWQPIEQELQEAPSGALTNGDNSFDVYLPQDLDQAPIRVSVDDAWVSEVPVGLDTESAELQADGVATYADEGVAASLDYAGLANGLKETINLADPSAPATYHFKVEASAGVAPTLLEDGSIAFRDGNENLVAEMPAPVMTDSAEAAAPQGAIHYSLASDGPQSWRLSVEADPEWLASPDRRFPVEVDPSLTVPQPSLDCLIFNDGSSQNRCAPAVSNLIAKAKYVESGTDQLGRVLLRFDTSAIPRVATINSATIGLYSSKTATNVTRLDLYDVNRMFSKDVTWKRAGKKDNTGPDELWEKEGGDYGKYMPTPTTLTPAQRGGSGPGWWNFSSPELAWLTQRWMSRNISNSGVLIKQSDETPHVCCIERRVEWESSAATNKPYLAVQYDLPAAPDSKVSSPTDGTKTAKRFILTSAWDHSNVEGVKFQYRINPYPPAKSDEEAKKQIPIMPWTDIPPSQVIDKNNQNPSWPIPVGIDDRGTKPLYWNARGVVGGATAKAKIQIRAVLSGSPGASGYTKMVEAELDKALGGPKDAIAPIGPGSVDLLTGNFSLSRTDVSIPAFNSSLSFSRSLSSAEASSEPTGVLGPGWQPSSSIEVTDATGWQWLKLESKEEDLGEGEIEKTNWASLKASDGTEFRFDEFEIEGKKTFQAPPELAGTVLYRNPTTGDIEFTSSSGLRTVFSNNGSGGEYLPRTITQTGGETNKTQMFYEPLAENKRRLREIIAPSAPGITCTEAGAGSTDGCRILQFRYKPASEYGAPSNSGDRLYSIRFKATAFSDFVGVASFSYDTTGRLSSAWDPRISPNLKETYTYAAGGQLASLTPPGLEPWSFQYENPSGEPAITRLTSVKRASLVPSTPIAQTTVAYGVPVSGSGAPYDMSPQEVAKWGQEDLPVDAAAIFTPDEVPANPPSSYAHATVFYMDAEGQESNVATPAGAGTSAPSVVTIETDVFGNISRELTPENRLRALAAGSGSAAKSRELDTQYHYSGDGTELLDERGPMRAVKLESGPEAGSIVQARSYVSTQYDVGAPEPKAGEAWPQLPTHETSGALVGEKVLDQRTVQYGYNWTLRRQTEQIVDPEGLKLKTITAYDKNTGLVTETRQPKDATTAGAGTTKYVYYKKAGASPGECESDKYAGLLCKVEPVAQPGTAGQPQLPIHKVLSYNSLSEPIEVTEAPPGGETRKTLLSYDGAGRQITKEITGGGVAVPKIGSDYATTTGLKTAQRIICPPSEPACDTQSSAVTYDALGRIKTYKDADENTTETTFDLLGRPVTVNDGKGTQTFRYDSATGLMVELEDSAAGIFTAAYNADGQMTQQGLPDGLTKSTAFDPSGAPSALTYTKASNCGASCTWLSFAVDRSARGQILAETGTLGSDEYAYDGAGRLTTARETPAGGTCTTRSYKFDENSNRSELTTIPGVGGICSGSGGASQKYTYDAADRLLSEGLTYDDFGRIKNLPASLASGKALATTYFSNDMVATQSQSGVMNSYQLDALLRPRQRLQAGGLQGTEIFHYAGVGDSPSWTVRGSTWTRNIIGIDGELAAVQETGKEVELQLTNLHGDVSATAALTSTATALLSKRSYDEFGNQTGGASGARFGWLGSSQRRTELPSGIVQMGARSYVPTIGRFLSGDPIAGGSANAYDYANADPVNQVDLSGTKPWDKDEIGGGACKGDLHVYSYGNHFHAKYRINCNVRGYTFHVLKIQKYFMKHTTNGLSLPGHSFEVVDQSEHQPHNPAAPRFQGEWGNWYSERGEVFGCTRDIEYQYLMFVIIRWTFNGIAIVGDDGKGADGGIGEEGGDTLELKAQEVCGHGGY